MKGYLSKCSFLAVLALVGLVCPFVIAWSAGPTPPAPASGYLEELGEISQKYMPLIDEAARMKADGDTEGADALFDDVRKKRYREHRELRIRHGMDVEWMSEP